MLLLLRCFDDVEKLSETLTVYVWDCSSLQFLDLDLLKANVFDQYDLIRGSMASAMPR